MVFKNVKEVKTGLLTEEEVADFFCGDFSMSYIDHPKTPLLLGNHALLKVNTNIGVSNVKKLDEELKKLESIAKLPYSPDSMMDHTIVNIKKPLWKYMIEMFDKPIGTLPHYTAYQEKDGLDKSRLLEKIEEMGDYGVKFMTLHPTSSLYLLEVAKTNRTIATTSRGGAIVLKDAKINNRQINVIVDYFDEIINIFRKYNITMSIGTTFRPARIDEALDEVQIQEIKEQKKYIDYAVSKGINVIMEGVGHLSLDDIPRYCRLIQDCKVPLMPLGPIPTDATIGFDHVSAAIGATIISMFGNIATINSITREEHTGGIPCIDSIIEGLKSARVVAHCINSLRFKEKYTTIDKIVAEKRATSKSCAISGGLFNCETLNNHEGCSRCSFECPLTLL